VREIGIGAAVTRRPLPHHRTYGSVYGGSRWLRQHFLELAARIEELKREIAQGVVKLAVRQRSARVEILQEVLDRIRQVIVARAYQYADDPVGATGVMVKDYRGKNGDKTVWEFRIWAMASILICRSLSSRSCSVSFFRPIPVTLSSLGAEWADDMIRIPT